MKKTAVTLSLVAALAVQSIGTFTYDVRAETDVTVNTSDLKEQYEYNTNENRL